MNIFSTVETKISSWFSAVKTNPLVQNLEADFENAFKALIGEIPWTNLKNAIASVATSELTTVEAHNKILALAASFVPGGNASLATMVAAGAVNTVVGLLQAVPVPVPATTPTK